MSVPPAPGFDLPTLDGRRRLRLEHLLAAGRPLLLAFLGDDPGSRAAVRHAARWQREHAPALTVAPIASGPGWPLIAWLAEELDVSTLLLDRHGRAARAHRAARLPAGVLVDAGGRVAAPPATGLEAIELLIEQALGTAARWPRSDRPAPVLGLPPGAPLPAAVVCDDAGGHVSLAAVLADESAVLLVWDPASPACAAARPALAAWPDDAPRLMAVGSAPDDRLAVPLVVDGAGALAAALGAVAPAAVLVDAAGRVAAPVARGADAILTLARASGARTP